MSEIDEQNKQEMRAAIDRLTRDAKFLNGELALLHQDRKALRANYAALQEDAACMREHVAALRTALMQIVGDGSLTYEQVTDIARKALAWQTDKQVD